MSIEEKGFLSLEIAAYVDKHRAGGKIAEKLPNTGTSPSGRRYPSR